MHNLLGLFEVHCLKSQEGRWETSTRPTSCHSYWRGPHQRSWRIESIGGCRGRMKVSSSVLPAEQGHCQAARGHHREHQVHQVQRARGTVLGKSICFSGAEPGPQGGLFRTKSSDSGHGLRECPQARLDQCPQAPARLAVVESLARAHDIGRRLLP